MKWNRNLDIALKHPRTYSLYQRDVLTAFADDIHQANPPGIFVQRLTLLKVTPYTCYANKLM